MISQNLTAPLRLTNSPNRTQNKTHRNRTEQKQKHWYGKQWDFHKLPPTEHITQQNNRKTPIWKMVRLPQTPQTEHRLKHTATEQKQKHWYGKQWDFHKLTQIKHIAQQTTKDRTQNITEKFTKSLKSDSIFLVFSYKANVYDICTLCPDVSICVV